MKRRLFMDFSGREARPAGLTRDWTRQTRVAGIWCCPRDAIWLKMLPASQTEY